MVATRRGVRVYSPTKTIPDQPSEVQATPSTARRTRRAAKEEETPSQHDLEETSSQPVSPPTSSLRRCTRASRLHSPEQPCTPVGSVHEAETSDVESCCSTMSDTKPRMTRTRVRQACKESQEDEEISEVESCCSALSVSKAGQSSRRSTRRKPIPERSDPADVEAGEVKVEPVLDAESCSSESQRVTRSQRKTTRTRSAAKQQTEDSEVSDVDSCVSRVSRSTTRRSTRSRRQTGPIPIDLDEASEGSGSPAQTGRRSRAAKGKTTVDVNEPPSCDSEGFESGPTYSMTTRRRGKNQSTGPKVLESDSDLTDMQSPVGSPSSSRGKWTPSSSRTGSGNSSRGVSVTKSLIKDLSVVVTSWEPAKEDSLLQDSRLESTLIAEDADCTLLEEDKSQILEDKEKEDVNSSDLATNKALAADSGVTEDGQGGSALQKATKGAESRVNVISEDDSHVSPSVSEGLAAEVVCEAAVMARDQQVEPPAENKDGTTSEVEMMQETVLPSEPLKPSETVTICDTVSENIEETKDKEEAMEVANEDTHPSQGAEHVDGDTVMETQSSKEEKMEVSTLNTDAQQVVDSSEAQVESIEVTSKQDHKITVDSASEQQPKDVIVQNTKVISLLVSSEDEDDYEEEEEREVSGEEEEEKDLAEERGRTSKKSEAAAESVAGLFMIDTRPGQAADENYHKDMLREEEEAAAGRSKEGAEQEEQDEEFVDEENDDDDDDEDAEILFSSRDPQSKELSSRIDPGIRLKELGGLYINFDGSKSKPVSSSLQKLKEKRIQDEVMKKSVIGPDFEKKDAVPPYSESKQALKLKHRAEREKTTGDGWFNMKAPEITGELKGDLQVLKMRGSLDSKRFYKKNDRDGFPKYFQVGTVVDSPVDFYHSRVPKKERKRTMVEELLADAEFRHKNKKKFQHIVAEKAAQGAGKRNKKKNKFHKK
ncbi:deoxynucleotidyltransferase terminal-interacting protein 2 [Scomber scombrus]|nr:deoxynucleotidyltransferase terminal-interacting protein 2 [Scomber scombrus]